MSAEPPSVVLGTEKVLGWPKSSFQFFCDILGENLNELFGQPNTKCWEE